MKTINKNMKLFFFTALALVGARTHCMELVNRHTGTLQPAIVSIKQSWVESLVDSIRKSYNFDYSTVLKILEADKSQAGFLVKILADKPELLASVNAGVIRYILEADKELAMPIANLIIKEELCSNEYQFDSLISALCQADKRVVRPLARYIIEKNLITKFYYSVINTLVNADNALASMFTDYILENNLFTKVEAQMILHLILSDFSMASAYGEHILSLNKNEFWAMESLSKEDWPSRKSLEALLKIFAVIVDADKKLTMQFAQWLVRLEPIKHKNFFDDYFINKELGNFIKALVVADAKVGRFLLDYSIKENWIMNRECPIVAMIGKEAVLEEYYVEHMIKNGLINTLHFVPTDIVLVKRIASHIIENDIMDQTDDWIIRSLVQADISLLKPFASLMLNKKTIIEYPEFIRNLMKSHPVCADVFAEAIDVDDKDLFKINFELLVMIGSVSDAFKRKLIEKFKRCNITMNLTEYPQLEVALFAPEQFLLGSLMEELNLIDMKFGKKNIHGHQHFDLMLKDKTKSAFRDEPLQNGFCPIQFDQSLRYPCISLLVRATREIDDRNTLLRLVEKSAQEEEKGNFTFIHGRQREFALHSEIVKHIVEMLYCDGKVLDGYYPVRKNKPGGMYAVSEEVVRKRWLNSNKDRNDAIELKNHYLYTCGGSFGGTGFDGSCTLAYFLKNYSEKPFTTFSMTLRDDFKEHDIEKYYDKYQQEFDSLSKDFMKNNHRGNILLISMRPEQVNKWVHPGATNFLVVDGKSTNDVLRYLTLCRYSPERVSGYHLTRQEWLLFLSDASMDPVNGVKIYPFTSDESFVRQWREKLDALFVKIKQDIEHDKQGKVQPQVSQNKTSATLNSTLNPVAQHRLAVLGKQMQMKK
jgi:hypothetical protein